MTILVIAEHDNTQLNPNTLNTLSAAKKIGTDITLLVAGNNADSVLTEAQSIAAVSKSTHCQSSSTCRWPGRKHCVAGKRYRK